MKPGERLNKDYLAAYKSGDKLRLSVLRLLKTAISNRLVELKRPGGTLEDSEIMDILIRQAKQRKDSIAQYRKAKRDDLAEKEERELAILQEYLPQALTGEKLAEAIGAAIAETQAAGPKDMGKVIGLIMDKYKGQADGKEVSALVKQMLAKA